MKTFLFITTLTPSSLLSPLRASLFDLYKDSLNGQTYPNWQALLIGEEEKKQGRIIYKKTDAVSKGDKLKVAYEYLLSLEVKPDYIIRLDDDDLISQYALEYAGGLDFDCCSDLYHSFYDIASGLTSQQHRDWLPNTIIHKYEHAVAAYGDSGLPLFNQDHSQAWHRYYAGKKIHFVPKKHPVYLRVLSPTTITSKIDPLHSEKFENIDMNAYSAYLKGFGKWRNFNLCDFECYRPQLLQTWEEFSGLKITALKRNFLDFFR
ncbi:MAG: hypothetical protein JWO44_1553 [Bacteroidetes bacterium]|nr:hypothetical protein [Bacteroidota bacterium]